MENTINLEQFNVKDCVIGGDECFLVTPKDMGVEWTDENKIFRSSIWRKSDMYPISLGYRKFMNYGEKPEFEPFEFKKATAIRKIDGSCLIVSRYKGELIIRTRGTIDASKLENAGLISSGINPDTGLVEIVEIKNHPFFIGVQYHPEYKSTVANPQPIFVSFVVAMVKNKK